MAPRRPRVDTGNESDEIIEVDASGAPMGIGSRRRKPATLFTLIQHHKDIFLAIAACCRPVDLLAVSFSCRNVHSFLKTPAAVGAWRTSWAREPGPPPPDCPDRLTAAEWTRLLYGQKCEGCWERTTRDPDWRLQVRFCSDCQRSQVKRQQRLLQEDRKWQTTSQGADIFRLVPLSKTAARGVNRHSLSFYLWVPHLAQVYERLRALDDEVDEHPSATRKRAAYVEQRERIVAEIHNMRAASEEWMKRHRDACVDREQTVKETRRLQAVTELKHEFTDHTIQAALAEEPSFPDPREKAWKFFIKNLRKACAALDLAASSGRGVFSSQAAKLQTAWRAYLVNNTQRDWEAWIPFGDITQLPGVKDRLPTLRNRDIASFVADEIPGCVAKWREQVEADLLRTLPAGYAPRIHGSQKLKLATSVWRLDAGCMPHVFPDMLLGSHIVTLDCGPLPYALETGPWNLRGFCFDSKGSEVVRNLCRLVGLDPDRSTTTELDESPYRVHCKRCAEPWPLVLTWRQAICHIHQSHDTVTVSPNDWRRAAPADVSASLSHDMKEKQWFCLKCPWGGDSPLKTQSAVKNHLNSIHNVTQPAKGTDFQRSLASPWVEPMNRFEVHAQSVEGQSWLCRICDHEGSSADLLEHLKTRHKILLVPAAVSSQHPNGAITVGAAPVVLPAAQRPETQRKRQRSLSIESYDYISSASPTPNRQPSVGLGPTSQSSSIDLTSISSKLRDTGTAKVPSPRLHAVPTIIKSDSPRAKPCRRVRGSPKSDLSISSEDGSDIDDIMPAASTHIQHQLATHGPEIVDSLLQLPPQVASPIPASVNRGDCTLGSPSHAHRLPQTAPEPVISVPAVEISGAADDDIEMIDFMLGNGEADDVPMQNVDQSPLDGDTDSSKLMMTANMLHQTAQTREVISHAIPPREVHNPQGLLTCRVCSRLVDRLRRFTSQSMDVHLRTKHDIVAPTFRAHYGNAPTKDEYEIMPWQHGVAYRCLLCLRDRKQAPWDFDKLNVHFSAAHRVADPQPGSHFDILPGGLPSSRVRHKRDRRVPAGSASDDGAGRREKKVKISAAIPESREDCFVCSLCDNGKTYKHPEIVAHVGHHHLVHKPLIRTHYTYIRHRLDVLRRKQKDANVYRFLCRACGETTVLFSSNGIRNHLGSRHRFMDHETDRYIEDADEILRAGHHRSI